MMDAVAEAAARPQMAPDRYERSSALKIVNGASLQPRTGAAPKKLVLLLHGFGSSGTDMISVAPQWQDTLPDTLFLAPARTSALRYDGGRLSMVGSFRLCALRTRRRRCLGRAVDRRFHRSEARAIESERSRPRDRRPQPGNDDGTARRAAATASGRRRRRLFRHVGRHAWPEPWRPSEAARSLVHGTADPVVPIAALHMSESELKRLGVDVTTHISYGVGHSVDPVGLRLGRDFVAEAFAR